jgi:hypothetical protein
MDHVINVYGDIARQPGLARVIGTSMLMLMLHAIGRVEEATALAAEVQRLARAHGNPVWITMAKNNTGYVFLHIDPVRAIDAFRQAFTIAQDARTKPQQGLAQSIG